MQTNSKFIQDSTQLINSIPSCTGDTARLAHRLSQAIDKLEAIISQADAQFKAGDSHATFNKQTIDSIR